MLGVRREPAGVDVENADAVARGHTAPADQMASSRSIGSCTRQNCVLEVSSSGPVRSRGEHLGLSVCAIRGIERISVEVGVRAAARENEMDGSLARIKGSRSRPWSPGVAAASIPIQGGGLSHSNLAAGRSDGQGMSAHSRGRVHKGQDQPRIGRTAGATSADTEVRAVAADRGARRALVHLHDDEADRFVAPRRSKRTCEPTRLSAVGVARDVERDAGRDRRVPGARGRDQAPPGPRRRQPQSWKMTSSALSDTKSTEPTRNEYQRPPKPGEPIIGKAVAGRR